MAFAIFFSRSIPVAILVLFIGIQILTIFSLIFILLSTNSAYIFSPITDGIRCSSMTDGLISAPLLKCLGGPSRNESKYLSSCKKAFRPLPHACLLHQWLFLCERTASKHPSVLSFQLELWPLNDLSLQNYQQLFHQCKAHPA